MQNNPSSAIPEPEIPRPAAADWLWRPWYAKLWRATIPIYWAVAAAFGPLFEKFGRFSPIEIPVMPGRTVAWRHGATWLGQIEDPVTEWSFGPEEANDLLAKLR